MPVVVAFNESSTGVCLVAWGSALAAFLAGLWVGYGLMPDRPAYFMAEMQQGRVVLVEGTRWRTDDCHKITRRFVTDLLSEPTNVVEAVTPEGVHRGWARLEPRDCQV